MRASLLIIFASILFLPDIYFFFAHTRKKKWYFTLLLILPTLIAVASTFWWVAGTDSTLPPKVLFTVMVCCSLPKVAASAVLLLGRVAGLLSKRVIRYFDYAAIVVTSLTLLAAIYGCTYGRMQIRVVEQTVECEDLPESFDGYRIVQISDIHIGTFSKKSTFISRLAKQTNAIQPDMIVFTGDLMNIRASELAGFEEDLSAFKAKDGIYSILGNHDYGVYGHYQTQDGRQRNVDDLRKAERSFGWNLLEDEHRFIHRGCDSIALIGVGDIGKPPFPHFGNLDMAMSGIPKGTFQILLSHDPSHWRWEVIPQSDIQLTLSGHTHAMQLKVGSFSPAKWKYPEWGGLYKEGKQQLFVSIGVGGTIPFRLGAFPEIVVLTLKGK